MQTPNVKYTNKEGIITIVQGTKHIEEGTFCEVDIKEMYIPASVKTLEYPLDLCEELEADLYLYGSDTAIAFFEQAMWRIVRATIYVMPALQADYEERLEHTLQGNWRELISVEVMPADKMNHYGPVKQPQRAPLSLKEAAEYEAIEHERKLLEEQWNSQCAQLYAVAMGELRAKEEVFKNSLRVVERKVWQFPFFSKPNPRKAESRSWFALGYDDYLEKEFNKAAADMTKIQDELSRLLRRDDSRTPQSAIRRMRQLIDKGHTTVEQGMKKIDSIRYQIKDLRADRFKLDVKPKFSFKRTLNTLAIFLSIVPPLVARFTGVANHVCFTLWGIALIYWCLYYVWKNYDFAVVVTHRADGSVEFSNEHMRDIKKIHFGNIQIDCCERTERTGRPVLQDLR